MNIKIVQEICINIRHVYKKAQKTAYRGEAEKGKERWLGDLTIINRHSVMPIDHEYRVADIDRHRRKTSLKLPLISSMKAVPG